MVNDYASVPVSGGTQTTQVSTFDNGFPDVAGGAVRQNQVRIYTLNQSTGGTATTQTYRRTRRFYEGGDSWETYVTTPTLPNVDESFSPSTAIESYELGYWNYSLTSQYGPKQYTHSSTVEIRIAPESNPYRTDQALITLALSAFDLNDNPIPPNQISVGGRPCDQNGIVMLIANLGTTIGVTPTVNGAPNYKYSISVNAVQRVTIGIQLSPPERYEFLCGMRFDVQLEKYDGPWMLPPASLTCNWGPGAGAIGGWSYNVLPPVEKTFTPANSWFCGNYTYKTRGQKVIQASGTIFGIPFSVTRTVNAWKPNGQQLQAAFSNRILGPEPLPNSALKLGRLSEQTVQNNTTAIINGWETRGSVGVHQPLMRTFQVVNNAGVNYLPISSPPFFQFNGSTSGLDAEWMPPGIRADGTPIVHADSPSVNIINNYVQTTFTGSFTTTFLFQPEPDPNGRQWAVPFAKINWGFGVAATWSSVLGWAPIYLTGNISGQVEETDIYPTWIQLKNLSALIPPLF